MKPARSLFIIGVKVWRVCIFQSLLELFSRNYRQLHIASFEHIQFLLAKIFKIEQCVMRAAYGSNDLIKFHLNRLCISVLLPGQRCKLNPSII